MACDPFITCDNNYLTWETLVKMLAMIANDGCVALRTVLGGTSVAPALVQEDGSSFFLLTDGSKLLLE